jgi:hypothetical protein
MRAQYRLRSLERRRRAALPAEHLQVFAQTRAALAAFRRTHGHEPTPADLHTLVAETWGQSESTIQAATS